MLRELVVAFGIVGVCLVIHIAGMVTLANWLVRRKATLKRHDGPFFTAILLIVVFVVIIILHLAEAAIWASFYLARGLFNDFETSFYFSLTSYSTVGYGDVLLPDKWRLLGTVEAVSGVLLCGLSTAFLFAIINVLFQARMQQLTERRLNG